MKRFRVEHKNFEQPDMIITVYNPPYEDEDVISRTKWKLKDCTITEITINFEGEE